MSLVIRMARAGTKKRPFYHIVLADSRSPRDGRFIERLGYYNPIAAEGEQGLRLSIERIEYWRSHGAQVSPTVQRLIKQFVAKNPAPVAAPAEPVAA